MKVVGNINNLPESLKPKKLNKGEIVTYQLLNGIKNPDDKQRAKIPVLYPQSTTIPSKDRIKNHETGEFVDIAIVDSFHAIPGTNQFDVRPRKLAIPKYNHGVFICVEGSVVDEEIYEYCELTNYNASNPNRDKNVTPLFKRVDERVDSKDRNKKRSVKLEAMKYASDMSDGLVKDFAAAMNWNETIDIAILRDKVETFAETNPEEFQKVVENKGGQSQIKATIKKAISSGKVNYDPEQHRICLPTGQTLIKLDRLEGVNVDYLSQAADWVISAKNGQKTYESIKKLMNSDTEE
jgi:hypothetical protein